MSNTFKKVTAAVAALSIAMSIVAPIAGVNAAATVDASAANRLANAGVIVDNSTNPTAYNFDSNITRREMLKIMMNMSGKEVTNTCEGKFSDLKASDWGCKYAEAALKAGFIAANPKFRPNDMVSKAEALKMVMQAKGLTKAEGVASWEAAYVQAWVAAGITTAFSDYKAAAKRAMVISTADSTMTATESYTDVADGEGDIDLGDLIGDLDNGTDTTIGTGTTASGTTSTGTTSTGTTSVKAGDLEVTLAATTPAAKSLPDSAEWVEVAQYAITAGSSDVSVNSVKLTRKGLGADDAVSNVALFANGTRVSKARTFNSSDDTADVAISPALIVKAGSTVVLVAKVNTNNVISSKKFSVELSEISSSAVNVKGYPVTSNEFEVQDTAATVITLSNDGTVTAPKLGALQAEVLKFKVKNDTTSAEDVTFSEITLKEDGTIDENTELANVALYYNGTKVATAVSNGTKYFTFKLSTPVVVKDGKTEKFVVKADVVWGASDTISFTLDNDLDVSASASKYGYVSVAGSVNTTALTVQAGEVTLTAVDPTVTDVREDKDDVILGKIKVATKGNELELSKVKFTVSSVAGNANSALENFELYDETNWVKYDLTATANGNDVVLTETDLAITIKADTIFVVRADTKNPISAFDGYDFRLTMTLDTNSDSTINSSDVGFVLKETGDDELVTDITPSTLTWKTINGQESSAVVSTIVMSDSTSVIGSKGIEVAQFQVSADDSSALTFTEAKTHLAVRANADATRGSAVVTIAGAWAAGDIANVVVNGTTYSFTVLAGATATTDVAAWLTAAMNANYSIATNNGNSTITVNQLKKGAQTAISSSETTVGNGTATTVDTQWVGSNVTSAQVSAVYLYNGTTLLDQVSGSQLADWIATFDWFKETIAKNGKVTYTVKIDLVDDQTQAAKRIAASIQSIDVEDEDADDVTATGLPGHSARDITIAGVGALVISVDNTDTETDKVKNVMANWTSPFVASFELTATNEAIKVKDLEVVATDTGDDFISSVSEVILYKNDKTTEIDREPVTSQTVTFDNINYVVEQGNTNIYVKVVTRKIGKDSAWVQTADMNLALNATDVEGNASGKAVTHWVNGADLQAANSLGFAVVPVKISTISFVNTYGWETVASSLTNGENTVWIIAVTTDSSTNTKTDGTSLKTELESMKVTVNTDAAYDWGANTAAADFTNLTIKKINGTVFCSSYC